MKSKLAVFTIATLLNIPLSYALPMLSEDGRLLTGVEGDRGIVYDVRFGDGIVGSVYGDVNFDSHRFDESHSLAWFVSRALNDIGITDGSLIAGCESVQGFNECQLFNPAEASPGRLASYFEARIIEGGPWFVWEVGRSDLSLHQDTTSLQNVTLVTYQIAPSAVTAPAGLTLLGLGLACLGWSKRGLQASATRGQLNH